MPSLHILYSEEQIQQRVRELAAQIAADFRGEPLVLLGVLKGACIFLADLARNVQLDCSFDFLAVSSYGSNTQSSGEVRLMKDVDCSMKDRNVILVEDILDTGLTLTYLKKMLLAHQPCALKIATLLDKPSQRVQPIQADYIGFTIPDHFVVGYGMDHAERYRNLRDICILKDAE
ncbi:MAG: hypoxanthine phosphoribosyltransferase [Candidatus Koribacter versatilis]|uniref:Hypoxanthine phosphoribosyltransferase n=1 Tax=Candidatus Korobacter versatilis TaxID=658062 RepID=A0A932A764_9BACT|nr:hypoxanthine phosphoribosyltransferase [Candidatus Koribacter versatilis]